MKNIKRINESQLRAIVAESVKRILNEGLVYEGREHTFCWYDTANKLVLTDDEYDEYPLNGCDGVIQVGVVNGYDENDTEVYKVKENLPNSPELTDEDESIIYDYVTKNYKKFLWFED